MSLVIFCLHFHLLETVLSFSYCEIVYEPHHKNLLKKVMTKKTEERKKERRKERIEERKEKKE